MISVNLKCVKAQCLVVLEPSKVSLYTQTPYYSLITTIPSTHPNLHLIRKAIEMEASDLDEPYKSPLKQNGSDLDGFNIFTKCSRQPLILNADGSVADIEQRHEGLIDGNYFDINITMYKYHYDKHNGVFCNLERIKFRNQ